MSKKERTAIYAVYDRLNKLSGLVPSNPCDMGALANLSRTCEQWIPRCMNALSELMDGEPSEAIETMVGRI